MNKQTKKKCFKHSLSQRSDNLGLPQVVQRLSLPLPMQGERVPSLVEELGSPLPHGKKKMKHKQYSQYCSKFKKTLQNGPHQNILKNKQARKQRSVYLESTLAEITLPRYKQSPEKPPKA